MDAKLKALKVVDLRQILATANVSVPAKATKADLILRIQASKPALDAYASIYPQDDLLAPPEEVDWNDDQLDSPPSAATTQPQNPKSNPQPVSLSTPAPVPDTVSESTPAPASTQPESTGAAPVDEELEKRKQRAARFGIPLVEPKQKKPKAVTTTAAEKPSPPVATAIDPKTLEARAARFGLKPQTQAATTTPANGKKRTSPETKEVDAEEQERRKKRAERFGTADKA